MLEIPYLVAANMVILSEIENYKEERGREITSTEEQNILHVMFQQRKEAIQNYKKSGRDDLVNREEYELSFICFHMDSSTVEK